MVAGSAWEKTGKKFRERFANERSSTAFGITALDFGTDMATEFKTPLVPLTAACKALRPFTATEMVQESFRHKGFGDICATWVQVHSLGWHGTGWERLSATFYQLTKNQKVTT